MIARSSNHFLINIINVSQKRTNKKERTGSMLKKWSLKSKSLLLKTGLALGVISLASGVIIGSMVGFAENSAEKMGNYLQQTSSCLIMIIQKFMTKW